MSNTEQLARRAMIFEQRAIPAWFEHVDRALCDLFIGLDLGLAPTVLVAECRTGHLVSQLLEVISDKARLMVVDSAGEMLDVARRRLASAKRSIFYSTQSTHKLSYADGVFHAVLSSAGLLTRSDLQLAGSELLRVLRPEGYIALAVPLRGTFGLVTELMAESIARLELHDLMPSLQSFGTAMLEQDELEPLCDALQLDLIEHRVVHLELEFGGVEDFFSSPLVEGQFLPRWLAICSDPSQRQPLLLDLIRAMSTYFEGVPLSTPAHVACFLARRRGP